MKENILIKKLFGDLFDGDPWIDVNLLGTLANVSAEQAAAKHAHLPHSIWEIVQHVIRWRQNILQRVQGKVIATPADNYFRPVPETSEAAWQQSIAELKETQTLWLRFLNDVQEDSAAMSYPTNSKSNSEYIHGIIQHDAYHLGQIVLLAKYF